MKATCSKLLTTTIRSLWSITKLLSIIYIVNNLTLRLEPISEQIFTQNFVIDEQKDKQVISFHALLLVEKIVVFFLAYGLLVVLRMVGSGMKGTDDGETVEHFHHQNVNSSEEMDMESTISNNKHLNNNAYLLNPIPTKHQLLIGLYSTISILLFVESQYTLFPEQLSYMKHMGLFVIFIIINYWFIDYFEVMKIPFFSHNSSRKWSIIITIVKYLYLLFKGVQFYYLSKCTEIIVRNNIPYDHYYGMWFEQFSTVKFDDFSFSTKWDLWLAIGLEGLGYAVIFWVRANYLNVDVEESCIKASLSLCDFNNNSSKNNNNNRTNTYTSSSFININSIISTLISTLQMSLTFVKYSIIVLIIYSIFIAGDFQETLSYLRNYPESYYTLAKYGLINFIICLSYAYCVVCYSPSVFLTVFVTRRVFQKFEERYQDGGFRESLQGVMAILALVCLELIVYEWFANREHHSNSYDKVNEKVMDEPSTSQYMYSDDRGEKFEMTETINSSSIGIHDEIAPNEIQKLNHEEEE